MTTITTRAGKGAPLTNAEVDANFTDLNTNKLELGQTFSSGTANGVLYLNASKVATSGTALVFDGSYFTAASGTGAFFADIMQVSGTATKVNTNGVGLEFRGGATPNITSYSRVGSAYLPVTLDALTSTFSISGTERMRLNSTSLNIGGNLTSTNNTLQVTGNAAIGYTTAAPTTGLIVAGNVGVGTDAPTFKLEVGVTNTTAYSSTAYSFEPVLLTNLGAGGVSGLLLQAVSTGTANTAQATISAFAESASSKNTALAFGTRRNSDGAVVEGMRLNSSGNLGLGTTSPAAKLQSSAADGSIIFGASGTTKGLRIVTDSTSAVIQGIDNTLAASYQPLTITGTELYFRSGSGTPSEKMRLDSSGNLGVGTNSPVFLASGAQTGVSIKSTGSNAAGINVSSSNANNTRIEMFAAFTLNQTGFYGKGDSAYPTMVFGQASGSTFRDSMTIDTSGNLGIGTNSPGERLVVSNAAGSVAAQILASTTGTSNLYFADGTTGADNYTGFIQYNHSTNAMSFGTNGGNTRLTLDSSGNLGVGTSSPTAKLDVNGGTNSEMRLTTSGSGYLQIGQFTNGAFIGTSSSDATAGVLRFGTAGTTQMRLDTSGNLGLGAAPGSPAYGYTRILDVAGQFPGIKFTPSGASTFGFQIGAGTNGFQFYDVAASAERMRIDSSGNLGIGTNNPAYRLDVSGQTRALEGGTGSGDGGLISATAAQNGNAGVLFQTNSASRWNLTTQGTNGANLRFYNYALANTVATFDSSGNLGLGVTPSSWQSGAKAIQIGARGFINNSADSTAVNVGNNCYYSGTNWIYQQNATASIYQQYSGLHAWLTAASGTAGNTISFTQAMTLDASGNLGLGVTPSAWRSTYKVAEIGKIGSSIFTGVSSGNVILASNAYLNSSDAWTYANDGGAVYFRAANSDRSFGWHISSTGSGTAGNPITFTQAMTLDASGNLLVGTTTPTYTASGRGLIVVNGSSNSLIALKRNDLESAYFYASSGGFQIVNTESTAMTFYNAGSERARITSGGYFKASNTGTYYNSGGSQHELRSSFSGADIAVFSHTHATTPYGVYLTFTAASPDNNTNYFLACADSTTTRCYIYSDGDLANHDGVYGTISDQKLKQDIVDAGSQWDDIKAIRFRKYRMKSDVAANPDAPALLGVIAQELEQVSPGLVDEHPDMETVEVTDEDGNVTQTQQPTGTTTKTVKSSILLMKAAVALQEAMARIEQLEAKVAVLEGK